MASALSKAVDFFRDFGLFDVVLPFLLVFTLVFALLEKTRVLGEEADKQPKKALNAMVAFVIAMFVVATNKIVTAINTTLPNVALLVVIIVSFLMLVGVFYKEGEFDFATQHNAWTLGFVIIIFIAIALIAFNSIKLSSGQSWLSYAFNYTVKNFTDTVITSIIFLIVTIVAIYVVVSGSKSTPSKGRNKKGGEEE